MNQTLAEQLASAERDMLTTILNWIDDNMSGRFNATQVTAALEGAFADVLVPALADEYRTGIRCGVCGNYNDDRCINDC